MNRKLAQKQKVTISLTFGLPFLSAWIIMLTLGAWHSEVPRVPAIGYWLTLGTTVSLGIVGRYLFRGHKVDE